MNEYYHRVLRAALAMTRQCWEQGMLSYALTFCGEKDLCRLIAHDMVLRQSADGRLCNVENTPAVTDSAFCVPGIWTLRDEIPSYKKAALRNIAFLLNDAGRAADGTLYHMRGTGEIWADSAAFLPYSLAITGHPEAACRQMTGILGRLYLPESGLYAHIWDEAGGAFPDRRAWAVGNGWILTGLLRTALVLESGAARRDLLDRFGALLHRMLSLRAPDGGFHDVLDDPSTFEEAETAAMVGVCLMRGVREGLLPGHMKDTALELREWLRRRTDDLGRVFDASSSPAFDRPGTSLECQAHVLMLEYLTDGM